MEGTENQQANGQAAQPAPAGPMAQEKRDQDGVMLFLSYFSIFALIPYLTVKDSDYIRWHAKQGLTFSAVWFGLWIAAMVIGTILAFIPVLGLLLSMLIWLAIGVGGFVLWVMCLVKAFGGERWKIPIIGEFADKW